LKRHPQLVSLEKEVLEAADCLIRCYENGGKVLICGNGGSCSDSDHIVGELMKGFEHKRPLAESLQSQLKKIGDERGCYLAEKLQQGLPAISLTAHNALITAIANDTDANLIFAQQVIGYGNAGDVLIAISSSGNSQNLLDAILTAKVKNLSIIGLTGETGGKMGSMCDILINVPEKRTALVQEFHMSVYHALCVMVENHFFGNYYLDLLNIEPIEPD
jgi:phosphoheptose isomerase